MSGKSAKRKKDELTYEQTIEFVQKEIDESLVSLRNRGVPREVVVYVHRNRGEGLGCWSFSRDTAVNRTFERGWGTYPNPPALEIIPVDGRSEAVISFLLSQVSMKELQLSVLKDFLICTSDSGKYCPLIPDLWDMVLTFLLNDAVVKGIRAGNISKDVEDDFDNTLQRYLTKSQD